MNPWFGASNQLMKTAWPQLRSENRDKKMEDLNLFLQALHAASYKTRSSFVIDSLRNWENKTEYKHIRQKNKRQNRNTTEKQETKKHETGKSRMDIANSQEVAHTFFKEDGQTKHMLNQPKQMSLWPGYIQEWTRHSYKPCMTTHPKHTLHCIIYMTWQDMTWHGHDVTWHDITNVHTCAKMGSDQVGLDQCFPVVS